MKLIAVLSFILPGLLLFPESLRAQRGTGWDDEVPPPVYVDVRAEIGIMTADNAGDVGFAQVRPTFWGLHGEVGHKFDKFSVFSGAGFSFMPFRQSQSRAFGAVPSETVTSSVTYFSAQVPVGVSYLIGTSFSAHASLNFNFMNMVSDRHAVENQNVPDDVVFTFTESDEAPSWQTVPELIVGFDYDIGSRLRFLFFGGFSLGEVDGRTYEYSVLELEGAATDPAQLYPADFTYRWWRFGAGLSYHIVK